MLLLFVFLLLSLTLACGSTEDSEPPSDRPCDPQVPEFELEAISRPFAMGFNRWPSDFTEEAIEEMYAFIGEHGDLILYHFDGGVPWPEALHGEPFSDHLQTDWEDARSSTPEDHVVFMALTPLNTGRNALAPYWGQEDNMPLPEPWDGKRLNDHDVMVAYLNYVQRAVDFFDPDYLAIGIEANLALVHDPVLWEEYKVLHRYVYEALKADHPDLPIFATFALLHLRGEEDEVDAEAQQAEVEALLPYLDILGLSAYPYGWIYEPLGRVPEDYFDPALAFGKPVAVAETGMPSRGFKAYGVQYDFDSEDQVRYVDLVLRKALEHDFVFVVNWANIDFDPLLEHFPKDLRDLGLYWAYTGLQRSDGCPKDALYVWDAYAALPREAP